MSLENEYFNEKQLLENAQARLNKMESLDVENMAQEQLEARERVIKGAKEEIKECEEMLEEIREELVEFINNGGEVSEKTKKELKNSKVEEISKKAEDIADIYNDIVIEDTQIDVIDFANDCEEAITQFFICQKEILEVNADEFVWKQLATWYCIPHNFETSYDVKMQLITDLDIELGEGTAEQSLEDLLLSVINDDRKDRDEDGNIESIIMDDVNNFEVDLDEQFKMVINVFKMWD